MKDFPKNLHLAIIIPVYNEKKSIKAVTSDVLQKIKRVDKKSIVVIDDGSTDNTAGEIPKGKNIYLVRHLKNKGLQKTKGTK